MTTPPLPLQSGSSKEGREVKQFHFTSWPDHGVPQYATAMLTMVRRVSAHHRPEHGPMLVHCSAGVGRSGTFMTIDAMLERLKHGSSSVDVYGHVSLIRTQRPYMVQTEDQYFFIYEAIAEAIVCGETEVSLDQLPGYISELVQPVSSLDQHDMIPIELQFKVGGAWMGGRGSESLVESRALCVGNKIYYYARIIG